MALSRFASAWRMRCSHLPCRSIAWAGTPLPSRKNAASTAARIPCFLVIGPPWGIGDSTPENSVVVPFGAKDSSLRDERLPKGPRLYNEELSAWHHDAQL